MPVNLRARFQEHQRPALNDRAKRLQRLADKHQATIFGIVHGMLTDARANVDKARLRDGVERNDWTMIREAIPLLAAHVLIRKAAGDDPENDFANELAAAFQEGGEFAVTLAPSFELVDQNAVAFARERAGTLFNDLDGWALDNARSAIAFGIENGRTVAQTADFIAQSLYLPERAMNAVESYFTGIIDRLERGEGLDDAARFVGRTRALAPRQFLDAQNVDTLVGRYADRWVKYQSEQLARTMTIEASNAGLRDGWDQAAAAQLFDASTATLQWFATDDDLTCPECQDLDGTEVEFSGGSFDSSFGNVDYPPAHPLCRCTVVLITGDESALPADALDALDASE